VLYVPYRGGGTATVDILGNHVSMAILPVANLAPPMRAHLVLPLAVTSRERNPMFGDIPTFRELRYPRVIAETWFWLAGPKNLSGPVVTRLYEASQKALKSPDIVKQFETEALLTRDVEAGALGQFVADELLRWRSTMTEIGLKAR
jgi:tripartite-type tricarboxylate transporter receptor subunit TctC